MEVIDRGEPAVLLCHWTGIYFNGQELGFKAFQEVVRRLNEKYKYLHWMKLSEIARYWAAKELTTITPTDNGLSLHAPYACPSFTLRCKGKGKLMYKTGSKNQALEQCNDKYLESGQYYQDSDSSVICFNLAKGESQLAFAS